MKAKQRIPVSLAIVITALIVFWGTIVSAGVSKAVLDSISTPDKVETSIGTLRFFDGAPYPETAEMVYDCLDTMRGVDTFLKGMPGASLDALIKGNHELGAVQCHQVLIMDKLMNSKSLFLTGNTSTMYVIPTLDLERDGPTVVEAPPGMLGAFNDAWFRYMQDIGPAGPDKGNGGRYLVLPPEYKGEVPDRYFVVPSKTYRVWVFMRASIARGLEAAAKNVKDNLRIPPNPPVNNFWALTLCDNQTRSMLQTSQVFPTVGSQTEGLRKNADGSYDIYFGPKAPKGFENNWLETIPEKGWFVALRMYGPLQAWIDKTWRPGEIELVK